MLTILVTRQAEFEGALRAMMPRMRATEPETERFEDYRVGKQQGVYRLLDSCSSREALDFYMGNPATEALRTGATALAVGSAGSRITDARREGVGAFALRNRVLRKIVVDLTRQQS